MDWTVVLVVLGLVALVATALLAAHVMNALGHGPDVHAPLDGRDPDELTSRDD